MADNSMVCILERRPDDKGWIRFDQTFESVRDAEHFIENEYKPEGAGERDLLITRVYRMTTVKTQKKVITEVTNRLESDELDDANF
jgi:hypothetical protein